MSKKNPLVSLQPHRRRCRHCHSHFGQSTSLQFFPITNCPPVLPKCKRLSIKLLENGCASWVFVTLLEWDSVPNVLKFCVLVISWRRQRGHYEYRGIFPLFQEFGLTEDASEALLQENPSLVYVSADLLRTRFNSLISYGISHSSICRLITRRPAILTSSEVGRFLDFVKENLEGICTKKLERLLITTEPQFLAGFDKKIEFLLKHGIPCDKLVNVVNGIYLKAFCCRGIDEIQRTIVFLNQFSSDLIIRHPRLLNHDLDDRLIPRLAVLSQLGGEEEQIKLLVRRFPHILCYTVKHLEMHIQFWRSIGLSSEEIFRIVLVYPSAFTNNIERKLQPRIEFLKQCNLNTNDIYYFLIKSPLFLNLSFKENLSKKLGFLVKLGYKHRTVELAMAMGATTRSSCKNMQMAIGIFLDYGLSCEDIFIMSKKYPLLLQCHHKYLEKRIQYLVKRIGEYTNILLQRFPRVVGYTVEHLEMDIQFWRSFGFSQEETSRIICACPSVFGISRERKLQPRIEFLQQCGLNTNDIYRFLIKAPFFLNLSFGDNLSKKLCLLVKLGYKCRTKELATAMGVATRTSCENMQMVVSVSLDYGLSCEDILIMSKRNPRVLQYNHETLENKMQYLVEEIGGDIGELSAFPAFLEASKSRGWVKLMQEEKIEAKRESNAVQQVIGLN
ncbi:hypothetical protein ACLOJK_004499 [Asimina triloba]